MSRFLKTCALSLLLVGCSVDHYVRPVVHVPTRPTLPVVEETAIACLSGETYNKLVERELRLREYTEQLEVILKELIGDR
jgi:hypothetical protein